MPQTRQQSKTTSDGVTGSNSLQPSRLLPKAPPTLTISKSFSSVSTNSPVGITTVKSLKQQTQTIAVVAASRKSQRAAAAAAEKAKAELQSQMIAQYKERKSREEERLNAQHIGMLRYLKLCL